MPYFHDNVKVAWTFFLFFIFHKFHLKVQQSKLFATSTLCVILTLTTHLLIGRRKAMVGFVDTWIGRVCVRAWVRVHVHVRGGALLGVPPRH